MKTQEPDQLGENRAMLRLLNDHRSGSALEIVVPILNEKRRIEALFDYIGGEFDIVLLDGGSSDDIRTLPVTIFSRLPPEPVGGEGYFVYYANQLSLSKKCLWLMADEFIEVEELRKIDVALARGRSPVLVKKYDWLYGTRSTRPIGLEPRGYSGGQVTFDPSSLHAALKPRGGVASEVVVLEHFHIWSIKTYLGTAGRYASTEVDRMVDSGRFAHNFTRRFIWYELIKLPIRMFRERKKGPFILLWMLGMSSIVFWLGVVSATERLGLASTGEQLTRHLSKLRRGTAVSKSDS